MKAIQHTYTPAHFIRHSGKSIATRFIDWCKAQEENRILWLSVIIAGHGCVITPVTVLAIVFTGNSMIAWAFAIAAMTMSLVVNLAALPTKITIPVFLLSLVIDLTLIIYSLAGLVAVG